MMGSMLRRASLGDGSTLSLDFTTGTLDPALSFTRASSGTYLGADGLVKTASTNVARFEYDTSGNPLGLLIEGSATNLLAHTERLDDAQVSSEQYWVTTYTISGATNGITGPDGVANSATQFAPIGGNGTCIATAAMSTSAQRTFSFWAKRSSGSTNLEYTLDNGSTWVAVTTTSSWQRFRIANTTAAQRVGFRFAANNIYEIGKVQLETGAGASSYISTGASTASRSADHCTMPTSSFITGTLYPQTLLVDCVPATPSSAFPNVVRIFDRTAGATFSRGTEIYYYNAANMIVQRKINASTNTERSLANGIAYNTRHKIAVSIDSTAFLGSYDGSTALGVATAPAALPTVATHLGVGCTGDASPAAVMFGTIRQIKFWPLAFTQADLNALTTL